MTAQITKLHRARYTPVQPRKSPANMATGPEAVPQAPMAVDVPTVAPHFSYPARSGYFDTPRKADDFQPLKSQPEIDDEERGPTVVPYVMMFATAVTVAAIMAAFDWLVS